jgi:hypothetical protein
MQSFGYLIIILVLILTLKKMFSTPTKVKTIVNKPDIKKVYNDPIVNLHLDKAPAPPKQIVYNPDQPDYHPGDCEINTGAAPTEEVSIPMEYSHDYEDYSYRAQYRCDMGVLLGDARIM